MYNQANIQIIYAKTNLFPPLSAPRFPILCHLLPLRTPHHPCITPQYYLISLKRHTLTSEYSTKYHLSGTKYGRPFDRLKDHQYGRPFDRLRDRPVSPPSHRARCPQIDTTGRDIPRPTCLVSPNQHHLARNSPPNVPGVPRSTPPGVIFPTRRVRCPRIDTTWRDIPHPPCPVSPNRHHLARNSPPTVPGVPP